jgi:succinate dehydrogenase/fumarate reductase-like Fe-S protein
MSMELQSGQVRFVFGGINGMPKLMCMTRLSELPLEKPVTVEPMKAFPP